MCATRVLLKRDKKTDIDRQTDRGRERWTDRQRYGERGERERGREKQR